MTKNFILWSYSSIFSSFISNYSSNPSNANHIEDVPMSFNESSPSAEDDKPNQPKVGIKKRNYDVTRKFQETWLAKFPWVKLFVRENGTLHIVKCKVCIEVKRKKKILAAKWDSFCHHACCQKVVKSMGFDVKKKDWFYFKVCKHAKNQKTFASHS
jgi:hypothetical protein